MRDWTNLVRLIDSAGPCIVTTHVNPDGDALGSELAFLKWLHRRGREARILNGDPVPPRYDFLDTRQLCETWQPERHAGFLARAGLVVLLDVARWDRLGAPGEVLAGAGKRTVVIDHHPAEDGPAAELAYVDTGSAATGELVHELIAASGDPLDQEMAEALYVAIMTDTGSFRYSNTTARTHAIISELLRFPIDTSTIYDEVYGRSREARLRLLGRALSGIEFLSRGRLVVMTVTQADMAETGAGGVDTDGFSEFVRGSERCVVAAVFTEAAPGRVKASLRSTGTFDVGALAREFDGGGHRNAAGITASGTMDEFRRRVLDRLTTLLGSSGGS